MPRCPECGGDPWAYECRTCGPRDCPRGDPLHYHRDGCPSCGLY